MKTTHPKAKTFWETSYKRQARARTLDGRQMRRQEKATLKAKYQMQNPPHPRREMNLYPSPLRRLLLHPPRPPAKPSLHKRPKHCAPAPLHHLRLPQLIAQLVLHCSPIAPHPQVLKQRQLQQKPSWTSSAWSKMPSQTLFS